MKLKIVRFKEAVYYNNRSENYYRDIETRDKNVTMTFDGGFITIKSEGAVNGSHVLVPISNVAYMHPEEEKKTKGK